MKIDFTFSKKQKYGRKETRGETIRPVRQNIAIKYFYGDQGNIIWCV